MKNLKRISGLLVITVMAFAFTMTVRAEDSLISSFADLKTCLEDETGNKVCKLNGDFSETDGEPSPSSTDIVVKNNITLDLNGHKLTLKNRISVGQDTDGNNSTAKFTITDTSSVGNGSIESSGIAIVNVRVGSTVDVVKGTLKTTETDDVQVISVWGDKAATGTSTTSVTIGENATLIGEVGIAVFNDEGAKGVNVTVNGTIKATRFGLYAHGNLKTDDDDKAPEFNVGEGATITSDGPAIYAAGYAKWNITGGTITGSEGISAKAGNINITGGDITGNGEYNGTPRKEDSAAENTGAALSVTNSYGNGRVTVSISGGKLVSKQGNAVMEYKTDGSTGTAVKGLNISDGYFESAVDKDALNIQSKDDANIKNKVTGGTYNGNVDEALLATNSKAEILDYSELEKAYESFLALEGKADELDKIKDYGDESVLNKAEKKVVEKIKGLAEAFSNISFDERPTTQKAIDDYTALINDLVEQTNFAFDDLVAAGNRVTFTLVIKDGKKTIKEDFELEKEKATLNNLKKLVKGDYDIEKFLDKDGKEITDLDKKYTEDTEVNVVALKKRYVRN